MRVLRCQCGADMILSRRSYATDRAGGSLTVQGATPAWKPTSPGYGSYLGRVVDTNYYQLRGD